MLGRILGRLGVDAVQFRTLVTAYLKTDLRASGGAMPALRQEGSGGPAIAGVLVVTAIGSVALAMVVAVTEDPLLSAAMLTTFSAANTMMLLLVDFTGVVVSPEDYTVLGHRPIDSRTYFAARLTSVATYVGAMSVVLALAPAITFWLARRLGLLAIPATFAAVTLCNLVATVFIIAGYVALLGRVHPARVRRAISYLQLMVSMLFYVVYYLATVGFRHSFLERRGSADTPLLWLNPALWFAAFIPVAGGQGSSRLIAASLAAVALTAVAVPIAAARLSLDYARRLGEVSAAAEPARPGGRRRFHLPGFSRDEARAVALLVRAQFRFDNRFRMAVLGILPLTAFYWMMDANAFADPFAAPDAASGVTIYFALVFLPITLHMALHASESWRAAWIFFASPASTARIVVATKNFVAVYFLGAYLVLLAGLWSALYQRVWHALVHAAFVWLIAHLFLQSAVLLKPALPFASEPRRGEWSSGVFVTVLVWSMTAALIPLVMPMVYAHPPITVVVFAFVVAATAGLEYALRLRVDEALGDLEFRS
jgi:hypothetical protein